eukprot:s11850_g1.t1
MCNIRAMQVILEQGVEGVKDLRAKTLAYYRGREAALRAEEEALKAAMDPEVREVMKGKNLLLFQEMLRDAGVDDPHLLEDMTKGFKLIGALPPSGQFPRKLKPAILDVLNPETNTVHYFEAVALPFGAVSSVTGFNRTARALRKVLSTLFFLVTTNFYDDFCQLELQPLHLSARTTAEEVLDLLGWKIAQGVKALPFAESFNMLGACISFEKAFKGDVLVCNKEGRVEAIEDLVSKCSASRRCDRRQLLSVKGKLLFAAGHVFGKCAWSMQPPVLIFTDGACEQEGSLVTHGALLFDPATGRKEVFGDHVPESMVFQWRRGGKKQVIFFAEIFPVVVAKAFGDHVPESMVFQWRRGGKKQVIFFAEIFPVVVAKATWREVIRGRRVLYFLDNEGARFTFIRSYSAQVNATALLMHSARLDVESRALGWYSRVPSKSNPSHAASRLEFKSYSDCKRVHPLYEALLPMGVLSTLFFLVTTNFYDDFCQLELQPLHLSARTAAEEVLDLLGWRIAQGVKALPFAESFNMLGACISFEKAFKGDVLVCNKEGRVEAIEDLVSKCIESRRCDRRQLLSVKGKLLFAAGHVFGKCAQIATQLITLPGSDRPMGPETTDDLLSALQFAVDTLKMGGPRCVGAWSMQLPVLIFTDGACEQEGSLVTHGALLFDPATGRKEVFGDHATWREVIRGRRVLYFLDNEGARFTFIRFYSAQVNATTLLMHSARLDVESRAEPTMSAQGSFSLGRLAASRLEFKSYSDCKRVHPLYEALLPMGV